ncbi:MAG TPA: iron ABC transporter ATP-binding protein, partial [Acidimicrobiaceae bacterium]|nr:iron ABC transporter ATP-binding protein [Acidimicrobiaceae bacterium]
MTISSPVVELLGVSVKYEERTILGPLDLEISSSDRWVVLGPNGSGKTSLIKILSLYRYPTTGTVEVLGETWGATDVRELRQRIGLASSSLRDQFRPDILGLDIVMTARHAALETWWHEYSESDREAAMDCLARIGAEALASRKFHTMSSGEQQRVQLARTLMGEPGLLLLD